MKYRTNVTMVCVRPNASRVHRASIVVVVITCIVVTRIVVTCVRCYLRSLLPTFVVTCFCCYLLCCYVCTIPISFARLPHANGRGEDTPEWLVTIPIRDDGSVSLNFKHHGS